MSEMVQIQQEIERMRRCLNDLVGFRKYNLADPDVTNISKYLDCLIVNYQRLKADSEQMAKSAGSDWMDYF